MGAALVMELFLGRTRPSGATFRAHSVLRYPGLKPWAVLSDHFMVKMATPLASPESFP
jgi:hypothetical protein